MKIYYVHGAGASEKSFLWLKQQLPEHSAIFFTYAVKEPVVSSIERLAKLVVGDEPTIILGHSLGGVMAVACADIPNISKTVSLNAPFGGIKNAEWMYMFSLEQLFHDMRANGPVLTDIRNKHMTKPHLAIVGTRGLPFTSEQNDGVVTVASQMALLGSRYEILPLNHFEVLLSNEVATLISMFMKE